MAREIFVLKEKSLKKNASLTRKLRDSNPTHITTLQCRTRAPSPLDHPASLSHAWPNFSISTFLQTTYSIPTRRAVFSGPLGMVFFPLTFILPTPTPPTHIHFLFQTSSIKSFPNSPYSFHLCPLAFHRLIDDIIIRSMLHAFMMTSPAAILGGGNWLI